MQDRGHEVLILTPQDYASREDINAFNEQQAFRTTRLRKVWWAPFEAAYRLGVLGVTLAREQPDILVATGMRAVWLAACIPKGRPHIAVGHGTEFGVKVPWSRAISRWAYARAESVVCVSAFTAFQLDQMGIQPRSLEVIHNGADDSRFAPLPAEIIVLSRKRLNLPEGRLLLTVGRVSPRKGQDVVIRAMPAILRRFPATHYLMAGLPEKEFEFRQTARRLGVEAHVHFLGRIDERDLVPLINACEVFLMTSTHTTDGDFEGFGIAVVEAALCGKPSVVSRGSGLTEAIQERITGLAVPQNDPEATGLAVTTLLADDDLRRKMGAEARRRALKSQTWAQVSLRYEALMKGLVSASRGTPSLHHTYAR